MGLISKLFGSTKRPVLPKEDISKFEKVAEFVLWFIRKEPLVQVIGNRSSHIIFNEGHRPKKGTQTNPESVKPDIGNLVEWFVIKVFLDLNTLKDASKEDFGKFIETLDAFGMETIIASGEIGVTYDLDFEHFVYEKEIEKIPPGLERERFKVNLLNDNVLGAEIRILAWLYHAYFGEWFQIKERKEAATDSPV